jgi:hypothetical protein
MTCRLQKVLKSQFIFMEKVSFLGSTPKKFSKIGGLVHLPYKCTVESTLLSIMSYEEEDTCLKSVA